jgi:hypothetical protein
MHSLTLRLRLLLRLLLLLYDVSCDAGLRMALAMMTWSRSCMYALADLHNMSHNYHCYMSCDTRR